MIKAHLKQAPGNKFFIVPRYPSGVRNQRFRWLVIYYPYTIAPKTNSAPYGSHAPRRTLRTTLIFKKPANRTP